MEPMVGDLVIVGTARWRIARFLISSPELLLLRRRFRGEGYLIQRRTLTWDDEIGVWRAPSYTERQDHREGY